MFGIFVPQMEGFHSPLTLFLFCLTCAGFSFIVEWLSVLAAQVPHLPLSHAETRSCALVGRPRWRTHRMSRSCAGARGGGCCGSMWVTGQTLLSSCVCSEELHPTLPPVGKQGQWSCLPPPSQGLWIQGDTLVLSSWWPHQRESEIVDGRGTHCLALSREGSRVQRRAILGALGLGCGSFIHPFHASLTCSA